MLSKISNKKHTDVIKTMEVVPEWLKLSSSSSCCLRYGGPSSEVSNVVPGPPPSSVLHPAVFQITCHRQSKLTSGWLSVLPCFLHSWCWEAEPTCCPNCAVFGHQRRLSPYTCSVAGGLIRVYFTFEKEEEGGSDFLPSSSGQLTLCHGLAGLQHFNIRLRRLQSKSRDSTEL